MQRMLLDWVSGSDVGHVAEALAVARGFVAANPGLELHLLVNASTTLELAGLSGDIARVYPLATQPLSSLGAASFAGIPQEWDFVVHRAREPGEPAEQRALFELSQRHFVARHWAGSFGTAMSLDGGLEFRGDRPLELSLPQAAPFADQLRAHHGIKIAFLPVLSASLGSSPSIDWWCQLLLALRVTFPDSLSLLVGQSQEDRGVPASGYTRVQLAPLFGAAPSLIDAFDLGFMPTLALLRDSDVLIAPEVGLARLASCVQTRRLVLSPDVTRERFFNQVSFVTTSPNVVDVVSGIALLCSQQLSYQAALALDQLRIPSVSQPKAQRRPLPVLTHVPGPGEPGGPEPSRGNRVPLNARGQALTVRRHLFCAKPFEHFEIQHSGQAFLCCPSWLPEPVGHVTEQEPLALWNGRAAQRIRSSILDGTFRYCTGCPFLSSETGPVRRRSDLTDETELAIVREQRLVVERIRCLNLAYDRSCNLSCPSCRTQVYVASNETAAALRAFQDALLTPDLLQSLDCLYVTGSGDPFASKLFRELLRRLRGEDYPHLKIALHTNGLLFSEENWAAMASVQSLIHSVEVSVDAATARTYELNRRGGDWDRLLERLAFIRTLREQGRFKYWKLSFVVQANNWREMAGFVELGRHFGTDAVQFTPLASWGTFHAVEFARRAVHLPGHPEHENFMAALASEPALRDERVIRSDFVQAPQRPRWSGWAH